MPIADKCMRLGAIGNQVKIQFAVMILIMWHVCHPLLMTYVWDIWWCMSEYTNVGLFCCATLCCCCAKCTECTVYRCAQHAQCGQCAQCALCTVHSVQVCTVCIVCKCVCRLQSTVLWLHTIQLFTFVNRARLHFSAKPGFQTDQKAVLGNQLSSATLSNQRQVETLE